MRVLLAEVRGARLRRSRISNGDPMGSDALPEVRILAIPRGRKGDRVHEPRIDASASL
jgi:hypothetical protein